MADPRPIMSCALIFLEASVVQVSSWGRFRDWHLYNQTDQALLVTSVMQCRVVGVF
jgi:hypothetical protein